MKQKKTLATGVAIGTLHYFMFGPGLREEYAQKKSSIFVEKQMKSIPKNHPDPSGELSRRLNLNSDALSLKDKIKYKIEGYSDINKNCKVFVKKILWKLLNLDMIASLIKRLKKFLN